MNYYHNIKILLNENQKSDLKEFFYNKITSDISYLNNIQDTLEVQEQSK